MYAFKAKLIGSNDSRPDHLYHEAAHAIVLGPSVNFTGNLINNTSITSVGIIINKETIMEPQYNGKNTLVVTGRHTDYDPVVSLSSTFCPLILC